MKTIISKLIQTLQSMKSNFKFYALTALCVVLFCLFLLKSCENKRLLNHVEKIRIPDTVFVSKPYKVIEIVSKDRGSNVTLQTLNVKQIMIEEKELIQD